MKKTIGNKTNKNVNVISKKIYNGDSSICLVLAIHYCNTKSHAARRQARADEPTLSSSCTPVVWYCTAPNLTSSGIVE